MDELKRIGGARSGSLSLLPTTTATNNIVAETLSKSPLNFKSSFAESSWETQSLTSLGSSLQRSGATKVLEDAKAATRARREGYRPSFSSSSLFSSTSQDNGSQFMKDLPSSSLGSSASSGDRGIQSSRSLLGSSSLGSSFKPLAPSIAEDRVSLDSFSFRSTDLLGLRGSSSNVSPRTDPGVSTGLTGSGRYSLRSTFSSSINDISDRPRLAASVTRPLEHTTLTSIGLSGSIGGHSQSSLSDSFTNVEKASAIPDDLRSLTSYTSLGEREKHPYGLSVSVPAASSTVPALKLENTRPSSSTGTGILPSYEYSTRSATADGTTPYSASSPTFDEGTDSNLADSASPRTRAKNLLHDVEAIRAAEKRPSENRDFVSAQGVAASSSEDDAPVAHSFVTPRPTLNEAAVSPPMTYAPANYDADANGCFQTHTRFESTQPSDSIVPEVNQLAGDTKMKTMPDEVEAAQQVNMIYLADCSQLNTRLDTSTLDAIKGLPFCRSKSLQDPVGVDTLEIVGWETCVAGTDEGDDWLRVGDHYVPMTLAGVPVLSANVFLVDKSSLKAKTCGLAYRSTTHVSDKVGPHAIAPWDSLVHGSVVSDAAGADWLQVGERFLPFTLKDQQVLVRAPPTEAGRHQEFGFYEISVDNTRGSRLGLELETQDDGSLLVLRIYGGLTLEWNYAHPDTPVAVGDRIVWVDDPHRHSGTSLLAKIRKKRPMNIRLERGSR